MATNFNNTVRHYENTKVPIIRGLTPTVTPVNREVFAKISGAPPAASAGQPILKSSLGLPIPNKAAPNLQAATPRLPAIFMPGPPPFVRPCTRHEFTILTVHERPWIRHFPQAMKSMDNELRDITGSWLQYLTGLHAHLEFCRVVQPSHRGAVTEWRHIVAQLHDIVECSVMRALGTAMSVRGIFPQHMHGENGLSPLEQARRAIVRLSDAGFGDYLSRLGDLPYHPVPRDTCFYFTNTMGKAQISWVNSSNGAEPLNFGTLEAGFLQATNYLEGLGGEPIVLLRLHEQQRRQAALFGYAQPEPEPNDAVVDDDTVSWEDEAFTPPEAFGVDHEAPVAPDDENFDRVPANELKEAFCFDHWNPSLDSDDSDIEVSDFGTWDDLDDSDVWEEFGDEEEDEERDDGETDEPLSLEDLRRPVWDILKDLHDDLTSLITNTSCSDVEDETEEPLSPEDLRRSVWDILKDIHDDLSSLTSNTSCSDVDEDNDTDYSVDSDISDSVDFEAITAEFDDIDRAIADNYYNQESGGDDDTNEEPEWLHDEVDDDQIDDDEVDDVPNDDFSDNGHSTPSESEESEDEPSEPPSDDEQDHDQPELLPIRQPWPAQSKLYGFQARHEALLPPLPPLDPMERRQPPIQRPAAAAPAPAPAPLPQRPALHRGQPYVPLNRNNVSHHHRHNINIMASEEMRRKIQQIWQRSTPPAQPRRALWNAMLTPRLNGSFGILG